jgi:hypothetical protein
MRTILLAVTALGAGLLVAGAQRDLAANDGRLREVRARIAEVDDERTRLQARIGLLESCEMEAP